MRFPKQSALALSILFWVLAASFAVFLLATAGGVLHERDRALRVAHEEAQATARNNLEPIALALWAYDRPGWLALLQSMTRVSSITRVELWDKTKVIDEARSKDADKRTDVVWTVPVMSPDGKTRIGSLKVSESHTGVDNQIAGMVGTLVVAELAKIMGLILILFVIVYWKVAHPLHKLANDVVMLDPGNLDARLSVARAGTGKNSPDELGTLVDSINRFLQDRASEMRKRLEIENELRHHHRDLAERVESRTVELAHAKNTAEAASLAKTRFLAAASHDLRQPIQAISLFADSLSRTGLNGDQKRLSGYLTESTRALGELLNVLLDISRLDAGAIRPNPEALPVDSLIKSIEAGFSTLAATKSLRFKLSFPFGNMAVKADSQLLMRLLGNLVGNAIKYTSQGGILVAIRRRGNQALIQVWDTGIGIAPEHMDSIFEEYVQVGNPERDGTKGLGLGLAIARRLARLQETELVCRSRPGKGSVFEFRLPLASPEEKDTPPRIDSPAVHAEAKPVGRRIILVEDDLMVGTATTLALQSCGMNVTRYQTAEDALADTAIADADFYISDLRLPGLNGIEFLDAVQQRAERPIKAAVLTGDTAANKIEMMRSTSWQVMFKPVSLKSLLTAIDAQDSVH